MAETVLKLHIKQRYDTEANWASKNPILLAGEIAISSDKNGQYKTGDGTKKWSELAYNGVAWTNVVGRPSTMKNPSALTVQFNGTTNQTYDGSAAKTVNITPAAIGAAAASHAHNYAGSSSAGGAANSAVKLSTARKIGNASFDGSADITIAQIGAAATSHTHTKSQITDMPTALKNPTALTISLNGASQGAYDGSAAKNINITANSIGAISLGKPLSGIDLDTVRSEGRFYGGGGNGCANTPPYVDAFGLIVLRSAEGHLTQLLYASTGDNADVMFFRRYDKSWTKWESVYSTKNKPTPSEIGAAAASHTHSYAGSSSAGGSANSAVKLATARKIGNASFDGTANITLSQIGAAASAHDHSQLTAVNITGLTTDLNNYNLSTGSPCRQYYIQKTTAGAANISNVAQPDSPFILVVESIRFASTTDYVTKQTFVGAYAKSTYERWCTSGTWSAWMPNARFTAQPISNQVLISDGIAGGIRSSGFTIAKSVPSNAVFTDTDVRNTAGATNTSSKIFLIGATSQAATPVTYSHDTVYIGTDGCLYSDNKKVSVEGHSHNYAGSSSAGGTANSALKWSTARTITVGGDFTGSVSLDGSANVSLNLYNYYSRISVGNKSNYPCHRIAKIGPLTGSYTDYASTLLITQDYQNGYWGMIKIVIRTNSATQVSTAQAEWLVRKGFSAGDVKIAIYNVYGSTYADVYLCAVGSYSGAVIRDIQSGGRGTVSRGWILINSTEVNDTTADDKKASVECWKNIETAATELHGKAYSQIADAYDVGTVSYALKSTSADKFTTARKIGNASFNGTANITLAQMGAAAQSQVDELQKTVDYIVATQEIDGGDLMDNGPAENTFDGGTL